MRSELLVLLSDYKDLTQQQSEVIAELDMEKLHLYISEKADLIERIKAILAGVDSGELSDEAKEKVLEINLLEKENEKNLKRQQNRITNSYLEVKGRGEALKEYVKYEE